MQAELVDRARPEVLARDIGASADDRVRPPGGVTGETERLVDPARHEDVGRAAGLDDRLRPDGS